LGEPLPEVEIVKPWSFKKIWRFLTSEPVEPRVRVRVKRGMEVVMGEAITDDVSVLLVAERYLATATLVRLP